MWSFVCVKMTLAFTRRRNLGREAAMNKENFRRDTGRSFKGSWSLRTAYRHPGPMDIGVNPRGWAGRNPSL